MMRAIWNGVVLAEAEHTVRVEGNHYFPMDSLNLQYFARSSHTRPCVRGRVRRATSTSSSTAT